MVSGKPVAAEKREVLDVSGGFRLRTVHRIREGDDPAFARHAEAQREWLAGGGAAVALLARHFAHVGVEQPRSLRARFLGVAVVRGRKIAIRQALLKDRLGRFTVRGMTVGLLVFFVPPEVQPAQAFKDRL